MLKISETSQTQIEENQIENQEKEYGSLICISNDAIYEISTETDEYKNDLQKLNNNIMIEYEQKIDVCLDIINKFKEREDILLKKLNRSNNGLRLLMREEESKQRETNNLLENIRIKDGIIRQLHEDKQINNCMLNNLKKELNQMKIKLYTPQLECAYFAGYNYVSQNVIDYKPELEIELITNIADKSNMNDKSYPAELEYKDKEVIDLQSLLEEANDKIKILQHKNHYLNENDVRYQKELEYKDKELFHLISLLQDTNSKPNELLTLNRPVITLQVAAQELVGVIKAPVKDELELAPADNGTLGVKIAALNKPADIISEVAAGDQQLNDKIIESNFEKYILKLEFDLSTELENNINHVKDPVLKDSKQDGTVLSEVSGVKEELIIRPAPDIVSLENSRSKQRGSLQDRLNMKRIAPGILLVPKESTVTRAPGILLSEESIAKEILSGGIKSLTQFITSGSVTPPKDEILSDVCTLSQDVLEKMLKFDFDDKKLKKRFDDELNLKCSPLNDRIDIYMYNKSNVSLNVSLGVSLSDSKIADELSSNISNDNKLLVLLCACNIYINNILILETYIAYNILFVNMIIILNTYIKILEMQCMIMYALIDTLESSKQDENNYKYQRQLLSLNNSLTENILNGLQNKNIKVNIEPIFDIFEINTKASELSLLIVFENKYHGKNDENKSNKQINLLEYTLNFHHPLYWICVVLASNRSTLMRLGISSIVTSGLVLQQLGLFITSVEAILYVFSWMYSDLGNYILMIIQLFMACLGVFAVLLTISSIYNESYYSMSDRIQAANVKSFEFDITYSLDFVGVFHGGNEILMSMLIQCVIIDAFTCIGYSVYYYYVFIIISYWNIMEQPSDTLQFNLLVTKFLTRSNEATTACDSMRDNLSWDICDIINHASLINMTLVPINNISWQWLYGIDGVLAIVVFLLKAIQITDKMIMAPLIKYVILEMLIFIAYKMQQHSLPIKQHLQPMQQRLLPTQQHLAISEQQEQKCNNQQIHIAKDENISMINENGADKKIDTSPVSFNDGTQTPQLSSGLISTMNTMKDDSIEGIYDMGRTGLEISGRHKALKYEGQSYNIKIHELDKMLNDLLPVKISNVKKEIISYANGSSSLNDSNNSIDSIIFNKNDKICTMFNTYITNYQNRGESWLFNLRNNADDIYFIKPDAVFSINVTPDFGFDSMNKYTSITLQENDLEITSDEDNGINILAYNNLYVLRKPLHGNQYILTASDNNSNGIAYLIVGYNTSAPIGMYSFNCGACILEFIILLGCTILMLYLVMFQNDLKGVIFGGIDCFEYDMDDAYDIDETSSTTAIITIIYGIYLNHKTFFENNDQKIFNSNTNTNCSIPIKQIELTQNNIKQSIVDLKNMKNNNNNTELVVTWLFNDKFSNKVSLIVIWYEQIIKLLTQIYGSLKCICQASKLMHVKKYIFMTLITVVNALLLILTIIEILLIIMMTLMMVGIILLFDNNIRSVSVVSLFIIQLLKAINDKLTKTIEMLFCDCKHKLAIKVRNNSFIEGTYVNDSDSDLHLCSLLLILQRGLTQNLSNNKQTLICVMDNIFLCCYKLHELLEVSEAKCISQCDNKIINQFQSYINDSDLRLCSLILIQHVIEVIGSGKKMECVVLLLTLNELGKNDDKSNNIEFRICSPLLTEILNSLKIIFKGCNNDASITDNENDNELSDLADIETILRIGIEMARGLSYSCRIILGIVSDIVDEFDIIYNKLDLEMRKINDMSNINDINNDGLNMLQIVRSNLHKQYTLKYGMKVVKIFNKRNKFEIVGILECLLSSEIRPDLDLLDVSTHQEQGLIQLLQYYVNIIYDDIITAHIRNRAIDLIRGLSYYFEQQIIKRIIILSLIGQLIHKCEQNQNLSENVALMNDIYSNTQIGCTNTSKCYEYNKYVTFEIFSLCIDTIGSLVCAEALVQILCCEVSLLLLSICIMILLDSHKINRTHLIVTVVASLVTLYLGVEFGAFADVVTNIILYIINATKTHYNILNKTNINSEELDKLVLSEGISASIPCVRIISFNTSNVNTNSIYNALLLVLVGSVFVVVIAMLIPYIITLFMSQSCFDSNSSTLGPYYMLETIIKWKHCLYTTQKCIGGDIKGANEYELKKCRIECINIEENDLEHATIFNGCESSSISCSDNLIWLTFGLELANLNKCLLGKESYIISCSVRLLFTTEMIEILIAILLINVAIVIHNPIGENIYSVIQKPTAAPTYSPTQTPTITAPNPTVISTNYSTDTKISPSFSQSNLLILFPSISPTIMYSTMNPMLQQTLRSNILSGANNYWENISDSSIDTMRYDGKGTYLNAVVLYCENFYILMSFQYKGYYYENQLFTMSEIYCNNQKVCARLQTETSTVIGSEEHCFLENNYSFNCLYFAPYPCSEQRKEIDNTRNEFEFICNATKSRRNVLFQIELNNKSNKFENITNEFSNISNIIIPSILRTIGKVLLTVYLTGLLYVLISIIADEKMYIMLTSFNKIIKTFTLFMFLKEVVGIQQMQFNDKGFPKLLYDGYKYIIGLIKIMFDSMIIFEFM